MYPTFVYHTILYFSIFSMEVNMMKVKLVEKKYMCGDYYSHFLPPSFLNWKGVQFSMMCGYIWY